MNPQELAIGGFKIPVLLVATVIGSLLTVLGVLVQNFFENRRLRLKLGQESGEKQRDRTLALKREVFLKGVEATQKVFRYLESFPDMQVTPQKHSEILIGYGEAISQLHLVAGPKVIEKLIVATETFTKAAFDLNAKRRPVYAAWSRLQSLADHIRQASEERRDVVNRFEQIQRINPKSPELTQLSQRFQAIEAEISAARNKSEQVDTELLHKRLDLHLDCQQAARSYAGALIELNLAARQELEVSLDQFEVRYREQLESVLRLSQEQVEQMVQKMKTDAVSQLASGTPGKQK